MKLYPFDVVGEERTRRYFALSTGRVFAGAYGKGDFDHHILDDSLTTIAREFGLTTKTREELAHEVSNVPEISEDLESPVPGVWYRILNTMYPGKSFGLFSTFFDELINILLSLKDLDSGLKVKTRKDVDSGLTPRTSFGGLRKLTTRLGTTTSTTRSMPLQDW